MCWEVKELSPPHLDLICCCVIPNHARRLILLLNLGLQHTSRSAYRISQLCLCIFFFFFKFSCSQCPCLKCRKITKMYKYWMARRRKKTIIPQQRQGVLTISSRSQHFPDCEYHLDKTKWIQRPCLLIVFSTVVLAGRWIDWKPIEIVTFNREMKVMRPWFEYELRTKWWFMSPICRSKWQQNNDNKKTND